MIKSKILTIGVTLLASLSIQASNIHQQAAGDAAYMGSSSALQSDRFEAKQIEGYTVARINGTMPQWGFVTYWMGIPTPSGESTIRISIYNHDEPTARYMVYTANSDGQNTIGTLTIPEDAPKNEIVEIDLKVRSRTEWSGIVLKKASKDELPGPWVQQVSVLVN